MAGSLFYGLNDLYNKPSIDKGVKIPDSLVFAGQVIDICLSRDSNLYNSQRDIGKIKFRNLIKEINKAEPIINNEAYPLDRSITRYPMPGEEVLIFTALGEAPTKANAAVGSIYFYTFVVSSAHNITYNSNPFLGTDSTSVDPSNKKLTLDQNKTRFEKITKDLSLVKDLANNIKIYKQLQPYEGDFILQGRFGNSIRFGSTTTGATHQWTPPAGPGTSGDGIIILRVDRDMSTTEADMLVAEDINKDDTSIYMATSQAIPLQIASDESILKSWAINYSVAESTTGIDPLGTDLIPQADLTYPGNYDSTETGTPATNEDVIAARTETNVLQLDSGSFFQLPNTELNVEVKRTAGKLASMGIDQNRNVYSGGSQLLLNSDRIILNSKNDYLMLFGKQGVALSSPGNVNIDAKDDVTIYSDSNLFLGLPGKGSNEGNKIQPKNLAQPTIDTDYEPLVLGLKLTNFLEELINIVANASILTPVGLGTLREDAKDELNFLKSRIPTMLSTYGYIDGITHEAADPPPPSVHPITVPPTTLVGTTTISKADIQTATPDPFAAPTPVDLIAHPTATLPNFTALKTWQ